MPASRDKKSRVLIVDQSLDVREVLRIALQRRGVETVEADSATDGLALADTCDPDLIVLDVEALEEESMTSCHNFDGHRGNTPLLILGTVQRDRLPLTNSPGTEFISKPYHFAPLVRKIEGLLQESQESHRPLRKAA